MLAVACGGCGWGPSASADQVADHVGTYEAFGEGGNSALLEGVVRVVGGCFLVETDLGERYLPYFPEDEVEWSDEGLRYAGRTYREGDAVALGGAVSGPSSRPLPARCGELAGAPRWTVAQAG